ncbi:MAG: HAD family hydrolase [Ruminococcaceae bacterium]|nr:HAD family hydrolase [Oscillospiraceae bacterium]
MKAVLFDLDGTLTDSGEGIMNCARLALSHYGIEVADESSLQVFVGPPLAETFLKFGVPAEEVDQAIEIYRSRYIPIGKYENKPYPGIRELLEKLKAEGHRLYVATSKPETTSVDILEHFDLAKYFDIIAGASFDHARHSKALVIAYLLEQTGKDLDAVMVGDTAFDVIGAKSHGIPTIGVSWGYGKVSDMEEAGAIGIAHTMDELYDLITK